MIILYTCIKWPFLLKIVLEDLGSVGREEMKGMMQQLERKE